MLYCTRGILPVGGDILPKPLTEGGVRKEGFLLRGGHGSGIDCGCGHRSWKQLLPLLSCSPPSFSSYPTWMPAQGRCGPHLRWVFPPQWDITEDALADILRSVLLAWVQIQQRWQPRLTVLVMEKIKLDILGYSINYMKKAVLGLLIPKTE